MKDYQACLEKLRADAAEAGLIRDLATETAKRDMFGRLHLHFTRLADIVERAMQQADALHSTSQTEQHDVNRAGR